MFIQLIYVSSPVDEVTQAVRDFIPVAHEKNTEHDITGMILSGKKFYLQVLEGKKEAVNQLYRNIVRDRRHSNCTLLRYTETKTREFSEWSMIHTTEEEIQTSYISPTILPNEITPTTISGIQALTLLRRVYILSVTNSKHQEVVAKLAAKA
jgi:hypothetical protein